MVEKGSLVGMGYIHPAMKEARMEAIKEYLQPLKENAVIRQLLNRYVEQSSHKIVYR